MTVDPSVTTVDRSVTVERSFDQPAERVFDAWLDQGSAGKWLFATPHGVMKTVEIDPRVGGRFTVAEQRGEVLASHVGEYLAIKRPTHLAFRFSVLPSNDATPVSIDIAPQPPGCRLKLTHVLDPQWVPMRERMIQGWTMMLDGLARTLGESG